MSRRLDKAESRKRWAELRALWNEFDPIGVCHFEDWPPDEYDRYCGDSMRLLEQNASFEDVKSYVRSAIDYMGMSTSDIRVNEFTEKIQHWYQTNWSDTYV